MAAVWQLHGTERVVTACSIYMWASLESQLSPGDADQADCIGNS